MEPTEDTRDRWIDYRLVQRKMVNCWLQSMEC
jgi:hypothetical protein